MYKNGPVIAFDELFDRSSITQDKKVGETYTYGKGSDKEHRITGFVIQSGGTTGPKGYIPSFYARPTEKLREMVCERALSLKNDSIYFNAIVFKDVVHLYYQNNLILNSGPPVARIAVSDWPIIKND